MNKSVMKKLMVAIFLAGFLVLGSNWHLAWGRGGLWWGGLPERVSLKGTFYPLEDKKQEASLHIFYFFVNQKEWLFKVNNARDLSGNIDMSHLLHFISPPILKVRGPENIIKTLQDPRLSGKPVKIEGLLYYGDGILQVTSATVEENKS
jgi:hypothetical protein